MIHMRALQKLSFALPKALIEDPKDGISVLRDKANVKIGHIDWKGEIVIYQGYEYCNQVIEAIEKQGESVRVIEHNDEVIDPAGYAETLKESNKQIKENQKVDHTGISNDLYATPNIPDKAPF